MGNPPFVGHQWRSPEQVRGMHRVWGTTGQFNRLDSVTCWFRKSLDYGAPFAFVATNSIIQGEQAGIHWPVVFGAGWHITLAHRSFQWNSEARGAAAAHCVIVGLARGERPQALVFDYGAPRSEPMVSEVRRLNGYLVNGPHWSVPARSRPQTEQRTIHKGSQPTDGARLKKPEGGYEKSSDLIMDRLIALRPSLAPWIRPFVGSDELISGEWRHCPWLKDAPPSDDNHPEVVERLRRVRHGRLQSPTESVRDLANRPTVFAQDRQPREAYIAIPEVSSELRECIPIALLGPEVIAFNKLMIMPGGTLADLAVLTSRMHMAWMRTVAGRLESRYSYSPSVHFTFPMPLSDVERMEPFARRVLEARAAHPGTQLDVLHAPDLMLTNLRDAHQAPDRAVDRLYRREGFASDRERVEHLFGRVEAARAPLLGPKRRQKAPRLHS